MRNAPGYIVCLSSDFLIASDVITVLCTRFATATMAVPIKIIHDDLDPARLAAQRAARTVSQALGRCWRGRRGWRERRTEAAQAAGMDRQTVHNWVHRTATTRRNWPG